MKLVAFVVAVASTVCAGWLAAAAPAYAQVAPQTAERSPAPEYYFPEAQGRPTQSVRIEADERTVVAMYPGFYGGGPMPPPCTTPCVLELERGFYQLYNSRPGGAVWSGRLLVDRIDLRVRLHPPQDRTVFALVLTTGCVMIVGGLVGLVASGSGCIGSIGPCGWPVWGVTSSLVGIAVAIGSVGVSRAVAGQVEVVRPSPLAVGPALVPGGAGASVRVAF